MTYEVQYGRIAAANDAIDGTTLRIFANIDNIVQVKGKLAGLFDGNAANVALPSLARLTDAINDFSQAIRRLNAKIDEAAMRFLAADKRGEQAFSAGSTGRIAGPV